MKSACRTPVPWTKAKGDPHVHAGLLRDRGLTAHKEMDEESKRKGSKPEVQLLELLVGLQASPVYKHAFQRWAALAGEKCVVIEADTAGPLVVGLGSESPLEAGLTIHHTYGMPFIPGSAIKGLCRRAALQAELDPKSETFQILFGAAPEAANNEADTAHRLGGAGCCVYWDAWYDPNSVKGQPFHRDVITVHHPKYYGSRGEVWPTDFDDPNPVPFLVVKPKVRFLFAVQTPGGEWDAYVRSMLVYALREIGVGAKTNAGYGRFVTGVSGADGQAQAAGGSDSQRGAKPEEQWKEGLVRFDAGRTEFVFQDVQAQARASGKTATDLMDKLGPEFLGRLKKKSQRMRVKVKALGNLAEIVDLEPMEGA